MPLTENISADFFKRLLQGAVIGSALTIVLGFSWFGTGFGWYTGEGARQLASQSSSKAIVLALAPICVERFRQSANAETALVELAKTESWSRRSLFEKTGFGKFSGSLGNEREISEACMDTLLEAKKI